MNNPAFAASPRARSGFGAWSPSRLLSSVMAVFTLAMGVPAIRAVQLLPGVYGYGTDRTVNRAGFAYDGASTPVVIEVTSLADTTAAGTLRAALAQTLSPSDRPRIIVFRVAGVIDLGTQLLIEKSNVTIAGQTAPWPGIALHGAPLVVKGDEILVQHIRMRAGDRWYNQDITKNLTTIRDAMWISTGDVSVSDVVFDHCTFGWSLDELVSAWNAYDNVTFNKCLFAEPLRWSTHIDENFFATPNNYPQQAEAMTPIVYNSASGATVAASPTTLAMSGNFHQITANAAGDYVQYTLTIKPSAPAHGGCAIGLTGIAGPTRGKFRVDWYDSAGATLLQTGQEFNLYSDVVEQKDFVSQLAPANLVNIPATGAGGLTYKVRVVVTGPGTTGGSNFSLGVDQIYVAQAHGMGPYFSDGASTVDEVDALPGKLTMIGNAFAHMQERGPWFGSQEIYFANNVLYHRVKWLLQLGVATAWAAQDAAVIGNTFIEGKEWNLSGSPIHSHNPPTAGARYHVNLTAGSPTINKYSSGVSPAPAIYDGANSATDYTFKGAGLPAGLTLLSTDAAFTDVMLTAGARPDERDDMEHRVFSEIMRSRPDTVALASRFGDIKDSVAEAGGWPVYASVPNATWSLPLNPFNDDTSAGYAVNGWTNIEEWLHGLSNNLTNGVYPGERGTYSGGAVTAADVTGYRGRGFVNFAVGSAGTPSVSTYTVWNTTAGSKILRIRYSNGAASARAGNLVVNGSSSGISFSPTGSFATWADKDVIVTLNAGLNTIALQAIGQDLGNVDELSIF
jgi:hypothetical protein